MTQIELISIILLIALGGISYLFFGSPEGSHLQDSFNGDACSLSDLTSKHSLGSGPVQAQLVRQSGNVYRDLGTFPNAHAAIESALMSFRRAKIDELRVTFSDENEFAAYRRIYNFRGRAEGKKLAGLIIRRVAKPETTDQLSGESFAGSAYEHVSETLTVKVTAATREGETRWHFTFQLSCARCGSARIEADSAEDPEAIVHCPACNTEFGTNELVKNYARTVGLRHVGENP